MFKFNFSQSTHDDVNEFFTEKDPIKESETDTIPPNSSIVTEKCEKILPLPNQLIIQDTNHDENVQIMMFMGGQVVLCNFGDKNVKSLISFSKSASDSHNSEKIELDHSDLIPGIYEGGGKVWECTQDLGNFLTDLENDCDAAFIDDFENKNILDLGCGAGILGILALKSNAKSVTFQDYNKNVLTNVTIPNVVLNLSPDDDDENDDNVSIDEHMKRCHFYSGDWTNYIDETINDEQFDVILTSETIYNPLNYGKILNVLKTKMKPLGCAYLAAKIYYFGVGGGIRYFEKFIQDDGALQSTVVWTSDENVPREILKITHQS